MRLVGVKRFAHVLGFSDSGEDLVWVWYALVIEDIAAYARPMYATNLRVMRVSDDRSRESDLGFR